MTSDDDKEISECIGLVLNASILGLVHESIHVNRIHDYTSKFLPFIYRDSIANTVDRELVCL